MPLDSLKKGLCGPQSQSGCLGKQNLFLLPSIKPKFLGCPAHSLVNIPYMLSLGKSIMLKLLEIVLKFAILKLKLQTLCYTSFFTLRSWIKQVIAK
jgi:hypothetical protein